MSLRIRGVDRVPKNDTWVRIEGLWNAHDVQDVREFEEIDADKWTLIPAPADPYLPA